MLPELGTSERKRIEIEALQVGLLALDAEYGNLPNTLYRVYMAYRTRFLKERDPIDAEPGIGEEWLDALIDARQLEAYVNDIWVRFIRTASGNLVTES